MSFIKVLLGLVLLSLILSYVVIPRAALIFTRFHLHATKLSPLSARGLEWRSKDHASYSVPTLRVERIFWSWGGCTAGSIVTLNVEGVTFRVRQKRVEDSEGAAAPKKKKGLPPAVQRSVNRIIHLIIGNWSRIACLFSIRVADVRVVLEDLGGAEATVREIHLGLARATPPAPGPPPLNPDEPPIYSSPPMSPSVDSSFRLPPGPAPPPRTPNHRRSPSRLQNFHRRASSIHSTVHSAVSKTASHLWSHATGSVVDRVTFTTAIHDVALVLPRTEPTAPLSSSMPNLSKRASNGSFTTPRAPSFPTSLGPLNSLLKLRTSNTDLQAEANSEKLVMIEGRSSVAVCIGFGPNRPLLTPDNLRVIVDVGALHISLDGIDKMTVIAKARPKRKKAKSPVDDQPKASPWSHQGAPRVVLRAFEFATLSLNQVHVSHLLPVSAPGSATSSTTDMSDAFQSGNRHHTLSLDFAGVSLQVSGCNSSTNSQLSKLFGSSTDPASLVHGVAAKLQWQSIELQCIAPGETIKDRSELVAIRQAEFDVITTWRPDGWETNDLLFADDVNLSVLLARGYVASVDVAGDLQLCNELQQSWKRDHPPRPPKQRERRSLIPLPPRIRVLLDVGPMSVVVANRASQDSATLTLASDGVNFGAHSHYFDVIPASAQRAKQQEDRSTSGIDITVDPPASTASDTPSDTLGLRTEGFIHVEPISLRMSIGSRNEKTYHIATIGRMDGKVTSEVFGGATPDLDDTEHYYLRKETHNADVEAHCDDGIRLELWNNSVIAAIEQLASLKEPGPPKPPSNILDSLPSGISARICLGRVGVFLGHEDPNPHCDLRINHGLWLQTRIVLNYAFYRRAPTMTRSRHMPTREDRARFRLNEDFTTVAMDYARRLEGGVGGEAAVFVLNIWETAVRPVFNGPRFVSNGGTENPMPEEDRTLPPRPEVDQEYAAWGWSGNKRRDPLVNKTYSEQAATGRSFIRIPSMSFTGKISRDAPDAEPSFLIHSRIERVVINGQLPDVYCSLLAFQTVRQIALSFKKSPRSPAPPKPKKRVAFHLLLTSVWVHFTFPLSEAVFFSISKMNIDKELDRVPVVSAEHVLLHVQSATHEGLWDELGRIKKLQVILDFPTCIGVGAKAFRVRIPTAYHLSQLILNINICIKSVKLLFTNLKSGEFHLEKIPGAEDPKRVPNLKIQVELLHFEARDHPVENKINLNNRVGLDEQRRRMKLEELFEQKIHLLSDPDQRSVNHLTPNYSVEPAEARWRLDWHMSRNWVKRIKKAREYERRREEQMQRPFKIAQDTKLPIHLLPMEQCTPLFRAALTNVKVNLSPPKETRAELIQYMGDVSSAPFDDDQEFSLMIPFQLDWTMGESKVLLRDYPLPLLQIERGHADSWRVQTLFVIAEELPRSDVSDSCIFFPVEILPGQCGHPDAKPLWVQVAKTINPVKTYARPEVFVNTTNATKITWCNSYSPGLTDVARMFDRLSSPPRDPSPKPGFWDKIRLILHWRVRMRFSGSVRFYLKGSTNPYSVGGYGSGFALVLRKNVVVEVGQPNEQNELIQFMAEELLVTIPDLGFLHDAAAVGIDIESPLAQGDTDRAIIERRSRKPCARFLNGIRFGLGFVFERTCRPWTCTHGCGETDNLLHRQCRIFEFLPHNQVTLRSPEAVERAESELGHPSDSYEGFRSDYIHFSVSLAAPRDTETPVPSASAAETHNSIHLSPKAFAHFFNWWGLFSSKLPAPIRIGKAFPDTPPVATKKFGRSLATIKYGCDLRPVFCSHMYSQVSEEMYAEGRAEYLGVKMSTRRMRIDAHQRMQEKRDWNEQLNRVKVITHKPFYAADLLLDDIQVVGIVADFDEAHISPGVESSSTNSKLPHVSELPKELRLWFNYFDFIDSDRKPFDRNPRMEIVSLGDCPHVFLARRIKARPTMPDLDNEQDDSDMEASKFGHEDTHVCYLGEARGIGPVQTSITQGRIDELTALLNEDSETCVYGDFDETAASIEHRIRTLRNHIEDLQCSERRQLDDNTIQPNDPTDTEERRPPSIDDHGELFQHTLHVHCPRLYMNNASRNIVYKYLYSRHNRQKEEYTTSHASIRGLRDGMKRRQEREQNGLNRDDLPQDLQGEESGRVLLETLERVLAGNNIAAHFNLSPEFYRDRVDHRRPYIGLPPECSVHPSWRALVIKPQISLRSSADEGAVVLVAVEEISFQGFAIKDVAGLDPIAMDVLSRNYIALRGMQAFYPSKDVLARACVPDINTGQPSPDFLPLEVFLDVRSETTEYDRIVLKTDMSISFDRFNHLRVPRGLEWPTASNDAGEPIEHLRKHQNATTVVVPMLTLSARPNHYAALYYIVTDLISYRDPQEEKRNDRINNFMYKFDQRDRDPQQLLATLFYMQQHIRSLTELQRGYEANVDLLTNEGKRELFRIRADLLAECDALFTVFEVINLNRAKDDARANARTLSRLDFRAGNIAWHMLRENGDPMVKLNIKHTLASLENNQDGSTDSAMLIGDLQALNSNADAVFPEVLSRWDKDKSKKKKATPFVSGMLCLSEQVAGIGIIRAFCIYLHPIRIRLEQEVGSSIVDYIFTDRTKRRSGREESTSTPDHPLSRTQSSTTISTLATTNNGRPRLTTENSHLSETVPDVDAQEMRQRAKANRTFVSIVVGSTAFVLDYKRDDKRKHHGLVWPECADFRLVAPKFEYHNEILTFKELFDKVKSDIRSSAWSQKGDIINQVFKKTSMFRSKKSLRQIAGINTDVQAWSTKRASPKSPLRFTVQNTASAPEVDEMGFVIGPQQPGTPSPPPNIFRSMSRRSDGHGGAGPALPPERRMSIGSSKSEQEDEHHRGGLIGKLMKHHKHDHMEVLADDEMDDRPSSFDATVRGHGNGNGGGSGSGSSRQGSRSESRAASMPPL